MEEKLHTMHCYVVQRLQNRLGVSPSSCPQGLGKSGGFAAAFFLVSIYDPAVSAITVCSKSDALTGGGVVDCVQNTCSARAKEIM